MHNYDHLKQLQRFSLKWSYFSLIKLFSAKLSMTVFSSVLHEAYVLKGKWHWPLGTTAAFIFVLRTRKLDRSLTYYSKWLSKIQDTSVFNMPVTKSCRSCNCKVNTRKLVCPSCGLALGTCKSKLQHGPWARLSLYWRLNLHAKLCVLLATCITILEWYT